VFKGPFTLAILMCVFVMYFLVLDPENAQEFEMMRFMGHGQYKKNCKNARSIATVNRAQTR
jgi:hypothetical protein